LDPNIHDTLKPRRGTRHHTTFTLTYDETKTDVDLRTLADLIKEFTKNSTSKRAGVLVVTPLEVEISPEEALW
jgi:hypothetical protein